MTLFELLAHAEYIAEHGCGDGSFDCAYQHNELVGLLKELAEYRATGLKPNEMFSSVEMAEVAVILAEYKKYKETNLTPDEIKEVLNPEVRETAHKVFEWIKDGTIDRLEELALADDEGRVKILPRGAKLGESAPNCFERCPSGWCLGFQKNDNDDEPCERCKKCWYCESGDYAERRNEGR